MVFSRRDHPGLSDPPWTGCLQGLPPCRVRVRELDRPRRHAPTRGLYAARGEGSTARSVQVGFGGSGELKLRGVEGRGASCGVLGPV